MGIFLMVPYDLLSDIMVVQHYFSVLLAVDVILHYNVLILLHVILRLSIYLLQTNFLVVLVLLVL